MSGFSFSSGTSRLLSDFISSVFFSLAYEGRARALSKWEGRQVCACREVGAQLGERGLADAARRCSHVLDAFSDSFWLRLSFFSWICASLLSCPDLRCAVTALVTPT